MTEMVPTTINGRWNLLLPDYRAKRPEWTAWEVARLDSMHRNIQPGDLIFDIGTEEGDLTALFATWGAEVVMFEPNCKVWPSIRAIWEANALPRPREWFAGFASDVTRTGMQFARDGWPECAYGEMVGAHGFSDLASESDSAPQIELDVFTADKGLTPDVITIDVEGAETKVLHGAVEVLEQATPLVYCSIHDRELREKYGHTSADLLGFMRDLGYVGRHLATDHESHWCFHHPEGRALV